jgi:phasin family protein
MADFKNPFADFDMQKMMTEFKLPNMDPDSIAAAQKKNFEALAQANQMAVEGFQAVMRRNAEVLQEGVQELQKMMSQIPSSPNDVKASQQAELAKSAYEKMLSNARESMEIVQKSQGEAVEVLNKRFGEQLDEIREELKKLEK